MTGRSPHRYLWLGLAICLVMAGILSYYASASPDGLERVAADLGFDHTAAQSATSGSPLADYALGGNGDRLSVGTAGVIGVLATAALAFALFALLSRRSTRIRTARTRSHGAPQPEQR